MIEIFALIVLIGVSIIVMVSGWFFKESYCLIAVTYLSEHPRFDFIIHIFTGLGSGWLIGLWVPKNIALILGFVLVVVASVMRYAIPREKLPGHLQSSGMGGGLPVGLSLAWLSYPWIPECLTLILGTISLVGAETMHYVIPNEIIKRGGGNSEK